VDGEAEFAAQQRRIDHHRRQSAGLQQWQGHRANDTGAAITAIHVVKPAPRKRGHAPWDWAEKGVERPVDDPTQCSVLSATAAPTLSFMLAISILLTKSEESR
jgi:hypothetical protein